MAIATASIGKKVLLGVCGSIAAYKAASLVRLLVKAGVDVRVVMTPDATHFISPLTLSTLSGKPVLTEYFDGKTGSWNNHVRLAVEADLILVAPASANTIGKFAHGLCDNLLTAVYLSARSPVFIAPAMDLDMWAHPATKQNIEKIIGYGNIVIPPGTGELASGLHGDGRLAEPEEIVELVTSHFEGRSQLLAGKRALVTAGPTHEAIDPVRYIGNHSSGKMGVAVANQLAKLGAAVTLIHGPMALPVPAGVQGVAVRSAGEMLNACLAVYDDVDIAVMGAAVADYTPRTVADQKIKKESDGLTLQLEKTKDILQELGIRKKPAQLLVGFALETENEEANAIAKLHKKNLDLIVLNSLNDAGAGFAGDTNKVTIIDRHERAYPYALKSKEEVASDICQHILTAMGKA